MGGDKTYKIIRDLEFLYSLPFKLYENVVVGRSVSNTEIQFKAIALLSAIKEYPGPKIIKSLQGKGSSEFWSVLLSELFAGVDIAELVEALRRFYRDLEGDTGYNVTAMQKIVDEFLEYELEKLSEEEKSEFRKWGQKLKQRRDKKEMDKIYEQSENLGMNFRNPEELCEQNRLMELQRRIDRGEHISLDEADAHRIRQLQNEKYAVEIDDSVKVHRG